MGRSVDIPTGMESEAEDPDGSDDDTSSILTASTSAEGVNVSHVTSVTSFSLEDYPTAALVFDLDCIAQAISYDERCRAPLQRLADMDSGDRLEQHLMTLLNYLPFDFREFATGSEEMELSRFICKEKDRIALAICETLDGTGQTPVTSEAKKHCFRSRTSDWRSQLPLVNTGCAHFRRTPRRAITAQTRAHAGDSACTNPCQSVLHMREFASAE
jgi:hypothetical protein